MDRSKALQKYLSKNSKSDQASKGNKNQIKIFDPDLEEKKSDFSEEEDLFPLMENEVGLGLGEKEKRELLRRGFLKTKKEDDNSDEEQSKQSKNNKIGSGQWVEIQKKSSSSSSPSPPRRRHDSDSESDQSKPELKEKKEADKFKNLKRTYQEALGINSDNNKNCDSDLSPARRQEEELEEERKREGGPLTIDFSHRKIEKIEKKKKIDEKKEGDIDKFAEQFKNAETIYRDKEGKIIPNINDYKGEEEARKEELRRRNEERIGEWGGGAYQKKMQEERKRQISDLKNQNFANYEISKEREKEMMDQNKFDDPMRKIIEKDKKKDIKTMNIMSIFKKCSFRGLANRFGIEPGHRWDGVDRSNGYERKYLSSINQRKLDKSQKDITHSKEM